MLARVLVGARDRGWEVHAACPEGPFASELRQLGVPVEVVPELKLPAGPRAVAAARAAGRSLVAARALRRLGRECDLVVVNGLLGLPAARLAGLRPPVAWIVHDFVARADWRAVLRLCAPRVDLAVPVSAAVAAPLVSAGVPTRVVHNGTPWPVTPARAFDESAVPEEEGPIIGCNALLTPWKGHDVLLEGVARADHGDACVELLGGAFPKDDAYASALRSRAGQADLAGRVRFLGHSDDPLAAMRRWTVAVSPSVDPEACPLAVLEAMSLGLPVVGTDHGGTPEVLGDAGVLVPARDPAALAAALDRLLSDEGLRRELGRRARARVAERFMLGERTGELLDVLAGVAEAGSRRGGPVPGGPVTGGPVTGGPVAGGSGDVGPAHPRRRARFTARVQRGRVGESGT